MSFIINGKELALSLKQEMAANVATFPEKYGRVPHLVVILVGEIQVAYLMLQARQRLQRR